MSSLFGLLQTLLVCGTIFAIAFIVVLAMPRSKMRDILKPAMIAFLCFAYFCCPVDFIPEALLGVLGFADDAVAVFAGIKAGKQAMQAAQGA